MSDEIQKIGFGYVDDTSEDLQSKSGGVFGLNQGAFLTKLVYNDKAGSQGAPGDAIDITIQVGDRDYMTRIFPTDKVFDSKGKEITDKNSNEYRKAYNEDWKQKNAVIVHVLKSVTTEDAIKTALTSGQINSFVDFAKVVAGLVPADAKSKPLDVFLEWQWEPSSGQDRTYLQLPRNMKGGYFVIPMVQAKGGAWTAMRDDKGGLFYQDAEGNKHPFKRDKAFMESPKANRIIEGEENANSTLQNAAGGNSNAGTGDAKAATW